MRQQLRVGFLARRCRGDLHIRRWIYHQAFKPDRIGRVLFLESPTCLSKSWGDFNHKSVSFWLITIHMYSIMWTRNEVPTEI